MTTPVEIHYSPENTGCFVVPIEYLNSSIWARLKLAIRTKNLEHKIIGGRIVLSWSDTLGVVRELGSRQIQNTLDFRFHPQGDAVPKLQEFVIQLKKERKQRKEITLTLTEDELDSRLMELGFTKRRLKPFQRRDLIHLLSLENGANFSVPGAGKTTVTFALHILTRKPGRHLLIVAPKAATQVWLDIVTDCMEEHAPNNGNESFTVLAGTERETSETLRSGATRFIISYDLMVRQQDVVTSHLSSTPTHLILDESHRMKAGWQSQRGSILLNIASLPERRDILTGTPMPQDARDIESQLDFLWPGHGLGLEILQGKSPREVLGNLYVRTTKSELGLPSVRKHFIDIDMQPGQLALYSIVRNEFLRDYSRKLSQGFASAQFLRARRSVMRLLQLSVDPILALNAMASEDFEVESSIVDQVLEEGNSAKMIAIAEHVRKLALKGEKSVIWTIFTNTIHNFVTSLADLNPVYIHGGVPVGDVNDLDSREAQLRRFHTDSECYVLVANPATAGEGISLHTVCHNALYADRSYVSTHYLQSIDRIHRLGLEPDQDTNVYVYRSKAPSVIGSIDLSVSRRLIEKIHNMQQLLNDPDLHEIAFDEEQADDPISYDVELKDIIDLISELEGRGGEVPPEE
ncbi:MAG: DEAD/DEAH box helicase [Gemmatimonadetes bacterium]|nr:DEAD/DEAH box helicase [Gemmatimonadota bacterium]